jgi:uncharacterized protein YoxC
MPWLTGDWIAFAAIAVSFAGLAVTLWDRREKRSEPIRDAEWRRAYDANLDFVNARVEAHWKPTVMQVSETARMAGLMDQRLHMIEQAVAGIQSLGTSIERMATSLEHLTRAVENVAQESRDTAQGLSTLTGRFDERFDR